jgi:hypothetical protein
MSIPILTTHTAPPAVSLVLIAAFICYVVYRVYNAWMEREYQKAKQTLLEFIAVGEISVSDLATELCLAYEPKETKQYVRRMISEGLILISYRNEDNHIGWPITREYCRASPKGVLQSISAS